MNNTSQRIIETAISHFAIHGYKGTALSAIADEVGIKKPSIYAHFKNKEELFYECLTYSADKIHREMDMFIEKNQALGFESLQYEFLAMHGHIKEQDSKTLFYIRFAYFPPEEVSQRVIAHSNMCIDHIEALFKPLFSQWAEANGLDADDATEANSAFICLYDGLMVELLFGSRDTFNLRLARSYAHFKDGLAWKQASKEGTEG